MPNRRVAMLSRPDGLLGRQLAREMSMVNGRMVASAIEALDLARGMDVLEIGFGRGDSLRQIAALVDPGKVIGVDHSPTMVRVARRRMRRLTARGRVEVHEADVAALPLEDRSVDRVLGVNTITYWRDLDGGLREVARALRDDGQAVLSVRSPTTLAALGITGPEVNLIEESHIRDIAPAIGLRLRAAKSGSDRLSDFHHFVLERV